MKELQPIRFKFNNRIEWLDCRAEFVARMRYAATLEIPHIPQLMPHDGTCVIVGAAPKIEKWEKEIKAAGKGEFNIVMSINAAHNWLCKVGRPPDIHVMSEH